MWCAEVGTFSGMNGILLYLDEIQYFNKRQQQSLLRMCRAGHRRPDCLHHREPILLCIQRAAFPLHRAFEFKALTAADIRQGLQNAVARLGADDQTAILIPDDALDYLAQSAGGDMRKALGQTWSLPSPPRRSRTAPAPSTFPWCSR